jgi:hypothetical protein
VSGSGSIIQTALTKKALRLELEYRQPSLLRAEDTNNEGPITDLEFALQYGDLHVWNEFTYLTR